MGANTERDWSGSGADRYWRRRAAALAGVLGAVGLLAWACSGGTGEGEPVQKAGAMGSASPPPPPSAMPTVTVTTTTTPAAEPADGGPCDDDDLVVTISAAGDTFAGPRRPEFRITVVNAGKGACTFDTGSLDVRITSGSDRIWSSAKCRHGEAPKRSFSAASRTSTTSPGTADAAARAPPRPSRHLRGRPEGHGRQETDLPPPLTHDRPPLPPRENFIVCDGVRRLGGRSDCKVAR